MFSLHPVSVFQHARKLTGRPYASTLVRAAKGGDDGVRGWRHDARDRKRGLEREGSGCSRITNLILQMDPKTWKQWNIWNAAAYIMSVETRGGSDGNIVRADPYSPKARRREDRQGSKGRGGNESGSRPGWSRTGEWQNMLLARQEAARGGRRTVPVAFESCRANASINSLVSLFSEDNFSLKVRSWGFYREH